MNTITLQGKNGLGLMGQEAIQVRKVNQETTNLQVQKAMQDNQLDEILLKDSNGDRFLLYADELSVKGGNLPKVGDTIRFEGLEGEVLAVDDELNEEAMAALAAIPLTAAGAYGGMYLGGTLGASLFAGGNSTIVGSIVSGLAGGYLGSRVGLAAGATAGALSPRLGGLISDKLSMKEDDSALKSISREYRTAN